MSDPINIIPLLDNTRSTAEALLAAIREMNGVPLNMGDRENGRPYPYTSSMQNPAYSVLVPGMMPTFVSFGGPPYVPPTPTTSTAYPGYPYDHVQSLQRDTSMLEFPNPYALPNIAPGRYPPPSYMSRAHYPPYGFNPMGPPPRVPFGWQPAPLPGAPLGPNPFMAYPPASRMHTPHIGRRHTEPRPPRRDTPPEPPKEKPIKRSLSETEKPKPESEEDGQCCICLEEPSTLELASINGCTHNFCFTCIEKWSERENTCPLCKTRFTKIDRVNKPPPYKKRKRGEQRTKLTKKVRNRDQRADVGISTRVSNEDRRRPIVLFSNLPGSLLSLHNALGIPGTASSALNELAARQQQPPLPFEFGGPEDFYWRI